MLAGFGLELAALIALIRLLSFVLAGGHTIGPRWQALLLASAGVVGLVTFLVNYEKWLSLNGGK
jgi:hypothetical protein